MAIRVSLISLVVSFSAAAIEQISVLVDLPFFFPPVPVFKERTTSFPLPFFNFPRPRGYPSRKASSSQLVLISFPDPI